MELEKKSGAAVARGRYVRRSPELKEAIVAQCLQPGASVAAVALAHGVNANLVRKWIAQSKAPSVPTQWLPVTLHDEDPVAVPSNGPCGAPADEPVAAGRVEIDLPGGARIRIQGAADRDVLRVVLASLAR